MISATAPSTPPSCRAPASSNAAKAFSKSGVGWTARMPMATADARRRSPRGTGRSRRRSLPARVFSAVRLTIRRLLTWAITSVSSRPFAFSVDPGLHEVDDQAGQAEAGGQLHGAVQVHHFGMDAAGGEMAAGDVGIFRRDPHPRPARADRRCRRSRGLGDRDAAGADAEVERRVDFGVVELHQHVGAADADLRARRRRRTWRRRTGAHARRPAPGRWSGSAGGGCPRRRSPPPDRCRRGPAAARIRSRMRPFGSARISGVAMSGSSAAALNSAVMSVPIREAAERLCRRRVAAHLHRHGGRWKGARGLGRMRGAGVIPARAGSFYCVCGTNSAHQDRTVHVPVFPERSRTPASRGFGLGNGRGPFHGRYFWSARPVTGLTGRGARGGLAARGPAARRRDMRVNFCGGGTQAVGFIPSMSNRGRNTRPNPGSEATSAIISGSVLNRARSAAGAWRRLRPQQPVKPRMTRRQTHAGIGQHRPLRRRIPRTHARLTDAGRRPREHPRRHRVEAALQPAQPPPDQLQHRLAEDDTPVSDHVQDRLDHPRESGARRRFRGKGGGSAHERTGRDAAARVRSVRLPSPATASSSRHLPRLSQARAGVTIPAPGTRDRLRSGSPQPATRSISAPHAASLCSTAS